MSRSRREEYSRRQRGDLWKTERRHGRHNWLVHEVLVEVGLFHLLIARERIVSFFDSVFYMLLQRFFVPHVAQYLPSHVNLLVQPNNLRLKFSSKIGISARSIDQWLIREVLPRFWSRLIVLLQFQQLVDSKTNLEFDFSFESLSLVVRLKTC